MRGMGVARTIEGFFGGASDGTIEGIDGAGQALAALVAAAAKRIGAKPEETAPPAAKAGSDGAVPAKR